MELFQCSKVNIYYKFQEYFINIIKYVIRWNKRYGTKNYFRYNNHQSYHMSLCVIHPPTLNVSMERNTIFSNLGSQGKLLEMAQNKIPMDLIDKIKSHNNSYELLIFYSWI